MNRRCTSREGVALIEAVLATVVISLMMLAALRTVTAARIGQIDADNRVLGMHLAAELMTEIVSQAYSDPDESPVFGPEPSEAGATSRDVFNDVDDYHTWRESPPQDRDGTPREHLAGWERSVEVAWVNLYDVDEVSLVDLGVKRIIVTVHRNGIPVARQTALRTAAVDR